MSPYRLLILLLSLSILLLVPTGSGVAAAAPVPAAMESLDSPASQQKPADDNEAGLPLATLCTATEAPAPQPLGDEGTGPDGLPAEAGTCSPLRLRVASLTMGGAPPDLTGPLTTPWPTGPPSR